MATALAAELSVSFRVIASGRTLDEAQERLSDFLLWCAEGNKVFPPTPQVVLVLDAGKDVRSTR